MSDLKSIYRLQDDVCLSYNKESDSCRILKINDDDVFYEANLVAGEIMRKINGKDSFQEIIVDVAAPYGVENFQDIQKGATKLLHDLIERKLIEKIT